MGDAAPALAASRNTVSTGQGELLNTLIAKNSKGVKVVKLKAGDSLADAIVVEDIGSKVNDVVVSTANGQVVRIPLQNIPSFRSRITRGNSLVRVRENDTVVGCTILQSDD